MLLQRPHLLCSYNSLNFEFIFIADGVIDYCPYSAGCDAGQVVSDGRSPRLVADEMCPDPALVN
jgi:hypothetical protein